MPIYEYQCEACGNKLEKLQKLSDDPLKDCPDCEQPELKKLVSAVVFRLKGVGWYETDFKTGVSAGWNEIVPCPFRCRFGQDWCFYIHILALIQIATDEMSYC